jgi:glycosyltransferase involved in cell wall biosynthesis
MKRILIFSLAYYPHVGGAEVAIKEITDRVTDSEFDMVTLRLSPAEAREERIGNVYVYRVGWVPGYLGKALFPLLAAVCAWKLHRRNRYHGMWGMMAYMVFPIVLLRMVGVRVPYAITLQEGDAYDHVFRRIHILPLVPIMQYGFSNAAVVQSISHFLAGWALQLGARNSVIIPNGVDAKKFAGDPVLHTGILLITTSRLVHKMLLTM